MAAREVVWTEFAELQFHNILFFYLERNRSNSYPLKIQHQVDRILDIVANHPGIGVCSDIEGIRVVNVDKFELLYELDEDLVVVVGFWDPVQNPNKRFDRWQ